MTVKQLRKAKEQVEKEWAKITQPCGCVVTAKFLFACDYHFERRPA